MFSSFIMLLPAVSASALCIQTQHRGITAQLILFMHYHYSRKSIFIQQKIPNVHKILSQLSSCFRAFRDTRHVRLNCHVQRKSRSLQHHGCQLRLVYLILTSPRHGFCRYVLPHTARRPHGCKGRPYLHREYIPSHPGSWSAGRRP